MMRAPWIPLLFAALIACDFPRPANVGDGPPPSDANNSVDASTSIDAPVDAPIDAPDLPNTVLHVSPSGDDANDGLTMPVKTLKRAIGLAAANREIKRIELAVGRYSSATGETFPYTVPTDVTVTGPTGGGAMLAGANTEPGISVGAGGLVDLDLEGFTTAITVTGTATLRNLHVVTGTTAIQVDTTGRVTATNLDIAGTVGSCPTGIVLNGSAQLTVTMLTTRRIGIALDAKDDSATTIGNANISGDMSCPQIALVQLTSTNSFTINDSLLDGGASQGIRLLPASRLFQARISNTIIRNMRNDGLVGSHFGTPATFQMVGGELSGNGGGAQFSDATWTFTNVMIRQNVGLALFVTEGTLIMRGCTVTGNGTGINVHDFGRADLGTEASPGNNVLQQSMGVALVLDGGFGATLVTAVGNTWNPNTQGADGNGRYSVPATVSAPIPGATGNNYALSGSWSLLR
jgi:hypothetical protein